MKLHEITKLNELNYPGNIGMMEMFQFYQTATDEEKELMRNLLADNKLNAAWNLLQKVTKTTLQK